jgi:hypothetical protein
MQPSKQTEAPKSVLQVVPVGHGAVSHVAVQ